MNKFTKDRRPAPTGAVANERIRATTLRVISTDNEQLGIMPKQAALELARKQELDLVIITDKSDPPVAKITNLNKYNYELKSVKRKRQKMHVLTLLKLKRLSLDPVSVSMI